MFLTGVFVVALVSVVIQLLFWCVLFPSLNRYKSSNHPLHSEKVSVVIAAKNEEKALSSCLESIIKEKEPIEEIIIIDDYSTDNTAQVIRTYNKIDSRIKYFHTSKDQPGKKLALTEAINSASAPIILLSDADCISNSTQWAGTMLMQLGPKDSAVLGYSPILRSQGLLNLWCRFETWITGIQYLSLAIVGLPYMGVGRNLLYRKSVFDENKGFSSHENIISGDDDLFINQVSKTEKIKVCLEPNAFMLTEGAYTWYEYFRQKQRHFSVGRHYRFIHIFLLSLFALSHFFFYLSLFTFLALGEWTIVFFQMIFIGIKWAFAYHIIVRMEEEFAMAFPFLDLLLAIYYLFMAPFAFLKKKSW